MNAPPPADAADDSLVAPTALPEGYRRHTRRSPLTDPWEPLFARETPDAVQLALCLREPHCNARGFAHGGLISSLADTRWGCRACAMHVNAWG